MYLSVFFSKPQKQRSENRYGVGIGTDVLWLVSKFRNVTVLSTPITLSKSQNAKNMNIKDWQLPPLHKLSLNYLSIKYVFVYLIIKEM